MPHVGERLLVHLLVLDDRPDAPARRAAADDRRAPRRRSRSRPRCSASAASAYARTAVARRPRRVAARDGGGFLLRIDAAREDRFEMLVDAGTAEPLLDQRVDGERRQVALVEDDRIAQRDRLARNRRRGRAGRTARASARARGGIDRALRGDRTPQPRRVRQEPYPLAGTILRATPVRITLNGEPYELDQPLSVQELLETARHRSAARRRRAQSGDSQAPRLRRDAGRRRRPGRDRQFRGRRLSRDEHAWQTNDTPFIIAGPHVQRRGSSSAPASTRRTR